MTSSASLRHLPHLCTERFHEYEGEQIAILTRLLCLYQCALLCLSKKALDHELHVHDQAKLSLSAFRTKLRRQSVRFEDPDRASQCLVSQYHRAEVRVLQARLRTWLRKAQRRHQPIDAIRLQESKDDLSWVSYDWFLPTRPLYPRRRALSPDRLEPDQRYSSQGQSPFFELPQEIRNLIYRHFLTGLEIEIISASAEGRAPPDAGNHTRLEFASIRRDGINYQASVWRQQVQGSCKETAGRGIRFIAGFSIVSFLRSCRRVYAEAIPILYGENVFRRTSMFNRRSEPLSRYLIAERLSNIRMLFLCINLGGDDFDISYVNDFPDLRSLHIRAFDFDYESRKTGSQLWYRLEAMLPILVEFSSRMQVKIEVDEVIPVQASPIPLTACKIEHEYFPGAAIEATNGLGQVLWRAQRLMPE